MNTFLIIFIVIIFFWIFLILKFRKKKYKISDASLIKFNKYLKRIVANWSYKEQIVDMDKLYHKILIEWWYNWTFWEILKSEPSEIWNLNKIWELHKLRNKLVHEFDLMWEWELKKKSNSYKWEVDILLKQFK